MVERERTERHLILTRADLRLEHYADDIEDLTLSSFSVIPRLKIYSATRITFHDIDGKTRLLKDRYPDRDYAVTWG